MMVVACAACGLVVRVLGDPNEVGPLVGSASEFWPDRYECPECGARARATLESEVDPCLLAGRRARDLTAQEALAAFHGLGLPDEQMCDVQSVVKLLREQRIRRVVADDISGLARCYLRELELDDGTRLYLGAGAGGALVYRMTRPTSYTERVCNGLDAKDHA